MLIDFKGTQIPVNVEDENFTISRHSGASLSTLQVQTSVRGRPANEELLALINQAKTDDVISVDDNGKIEKQWKIGNTSWHYREGNPVYHHTLELTEVEQLNPSSFTLDDMTLQPYEYKEHFVDDILGIDAKVVLTEVQHLRVKAMQRSKDLFPVIRHGISETPIQMELGLCYWSQHDNSYKYHLSLRGQGKGEKSIALTLAFRWMRNLRNQVADNTATVDVLLGTLRNKGILYG